MPNHKAIPLKMKTRTLLAATVSATAFLSWSCGGNSSAKQDSISEKTAACTTATIDSTQATDSGAKDTTEYIAPDTRFKAIWSAGDGMYTYAEPDPDKSQKGSTGLLWGIMDSKFKVIVKPNSTHPYQNLKGEYFLIYNKKDECAVADRKGKIIMPFDKTYRHINGEWCLISNYDYKSDTGTGDVYHLPDGKHYSSFKTHGNPTLIGNAIIAVKDGKHALLNLKGKALTPYEYDEMDTEIVNGLIGVSKNGKTGFIDTKGKVRIPLKFKAVPNEQRVDTYALRFVDGLFPVYNGTKWGFINTSGRLVIPYTYDAAHPFAKGLAEVRTSKDTKNESYRYIDTHGKTVLTRTYKDNNNGEFVAETRQILVRDPETKLYGYKDLSGRWVITAEYDDAFPFTMNGHYLLRKDGAWHLFSAKGKLIERNFTLHPGNHFMAG